MKKMRLTVCFVIVFVLFFSSCQPKVDIEKEKDAIKAVLELEKKGYFDKDFGTIASTWAQKPFSVKLFMSAEGETDWFGWAKISEGDKEGLSKDYSDYKDRRVEYSDFQFNIYGSNAWAIFKARWNWTFKDEQQKLEQTRIMAFEKIKGEWKITLMAIYNIPTER
jgi:hypothetical protein